jgi:hypothetical protein
VTGTYRKVAVSTQGPYFPKAKPGKAVSASKFDPATDLVNFSLTHDWAAATGGAQITDFNGPDYTQFGCGPQGAIDLSQGTGWGSTTGNDAGDPTNTFVNKHITVQLPQAVDITSFRIDPSATCGDGLSASTGAVTIAVSPTGAPGTYTNVASATFDNGDVGHYNTVSLSSAANNVQFVRLTITGNQVPDFATTCPNGPYSGCEFTDLTEFAVLGTP